MVQPFGVASNEIFDAIEDANTLIEAEEAYDHPEIKLPKPRGPRP